VRDLIVNLDTHTAPFAIIEYGGTLGLGETRVAVPLTDLKWSGQAGQFICTATKQQFDSASSTPKGGWMAVLGEDWTKNVDRYYGQPSAMTVSRFERQETTGMNEGREAVRNPSEQKGARSLEDPQPAANLGTTNTLAKPTDEVLMTKVNSLIKQDLGNQASNIQVTIAKGVVTLNGKVATEAQKTMLEKQVKALPGVDRVQDNLITRSY
jgi:BON domain